VYSIIVTTLQAGVDKQPVKIIIPSLSIQY